MEFSVLERQQARLSWPPQQSYPNSTQFHQRNYDFALQEMGDGPSKVKQQLGCSGNVISSASSDASAAMKLERAQDMSLVKKMDSTSSRGNSKKRKAESILVEEYKDKCNIGDAEEAESKITKKGSRETSADMSKENSKSPEAQKPDYIHVRARRGQASDSHSLAERARREKISKKMKCLQDLVPGCNEVMGKAGMLDEIINYVQSLQRQVEFLSMKLSALNPQLDFKIDDFFAKQFPAYLANFPAAATSARPVDFACNQLNPTHQESPSCNLDVLALINPFQEAAQRITTSSMSFPELYLDSSYLSRVQPFTNLDANSQTLYGHGFQ